MRKIAFTLSEVLITLVIIGIVAAITIPALMNNTNAHEYRSALKKAISGINQALVLNYALTGLSAHDYTSAESLVAEIFNRRMNVIDGGNEFTSSNCDGVVFTTDDGMIFCVNNYSSAYSDVKGVSCDIYNMTPCVQSDGPNLWIDVNGVRNPNKATTSYQRPKDIYQAQIYAQKVVPYGAPTQQVMYDKVLSLNNNNQDSEQGSDGDEDNQPINPPSSDDDKPIIPPDYDGELPNIDDDSDVPDEDSPWYDQWDPSKWPSWRDFLNWIRDFILGLIT